MADEDLLFGAVADQWMHLDFPLASPMAPLWPVTSLSEESFDGFDQIVVDDQQGTQPSQTAPPQAPAQAPPSERQGASDRAWRRAESSGDKQAAPLANAQVTVAVKTRDDKDQRCEIDETLYSSLVYQFEYSLLLEPQSPVPQVCACVQLVDTKTQTELRSSDGKPLLTGNVRVVCSESSCSSDGGATSTHLLTGRSKIKIKGISSRFPGRETWLLKLSLFDLLHDHDNPAVVLFSAPFKVRARRRESRGTKRTAATAELVTELPSKLPRRADREGAFPEQVFAPIEDPSAAFTDCVHRIFALLSRLPEEDRLQAIEMLHSKLISEF